MLTRVHRFPPSQSPRSSEVQPARLTQECFPVPEANCIADSNFVRARAAESATLPAFRWLRAQMPLVVFLCLQLYFSQTIYRFPLHFFWRLHEIFREEHILSFDEKILEAGSKTTFRIDPAKKLKPRKASAGLASKAI